MKKRNLMKDKRGWIRIVEAFVAILLISGVLILTLNKESVKTDSSSEIQDIEDFILRDIELNNTLRDEIVNVVSPPVEWDNFESSGLTKTKSKITDNTPSNLNCRAKVCVLEDSCVLDELINKSVYTESVTIFSSLDDYNPRQLKLFCFEI